MACNAMGCIKPITAYAVDFRRFRPGAPGLDLRGESIWDSLTRRSSSDLETRITLAIRPANRLNSVVSSNDGSDMPSFYAFRFPRPSCHCLHSTQGVDGAA